MSRLWCKGRARPSGLSPGRCGLVGLAAAWLSAGPLLAQVEGEAGARRDTAVDDGEGRAEDSELTTDLRVEDLSNLSIEQLMDVRIDSVEAASKRPQKIVDAPASVTIITADEIRKFGYRKLSDILRSAPGLYVTNDRNYEAVGVRGFNRPGDFNTRVLLLVDGHRVNDNIYMQGPIGNDFHIDVTLIDRIEIVRGPGSALYGSSAFFGVVNVITRRGRQLDGVEVEGTAGSFESYTGRLSYGKRLESGLEVLLSGSFGDSEGQTLFYREYDDPSTFNGVARNADNESFQRLLAKIAYEDFSLAAAFVRREKGVPTGSFGVEFGDTRNRSEDDRAYVTLGYAHQFEEAVDVSAQLYYDHYLYKGDYVFDYPPVTVNKDLSRGGLWGAEVKATTELIPRNRLTVGFELTHNYQQNQKNSDVEVYFHDRRDTLSLGLYAMDELRITDEVLLNAGVRYDHYEITGDTVNPRIGLLATPHEGTTIKLLYGTAYRSPSVFELYYHDGFATSKPNPNLDPERISTYEAVLEQLVGSDLHFTGSVYYYEIKDLISYVADESDGLLHFQNTEEVKAFGFELEADGKWRALRGRASYSWQKAEEPDLNRELTNSPRHLLKANLSVPLVSEKVFASLEAQYMSRRKTIARDRVKEHLLLNATLYARDLLPGLQASISLYNLLDERYADPGSEEHLQDGIEQDGRTLFFRLMCRF